MGPLVVIHWNWHWEEVSLGAEEFWSLGTAGLEEKLPVSMLAKRDLRFPVKFLEDGRFVPRDFNSDEGLVEEDDDAEEVSDVSDEDTDLTIAL